MVATEERDLVEVAFGAGLWTSSGQPYGAGDRWRLLTTSLYSSCGAKMSGKLESCLIIADITPKVSRSKSAQVRTSGKGLEWGYSQRTVHPHVCACSH